MALAGKDSDVGYMIPKDMVPRATRVKNKAPAAVQITAEQILREARERQEVEIRPPKQKITERTELSDYRLRRRKEFEDQIRRQGSSTQVWVKYARWEEAQQDYARARSVWERAMVGGYGNRTLWLKYAEFEMRNKFVNRARNVFDLALTTLPRVDQLWYKYIHMEEILGNIAGARQIFQRWIKLSPDQPAWHSFLKFELRYNEIERVRTIYHQFLACHPKVSTYIRYAKFEMSFGEAKNAREVYERAMEKLADYDDEEAEMLFVAFADFEERCKDVERARCIYKFALDHHIPKGKAEALYSKFVAFEKQYGDKDGIEDAIVAKRRFQYEKEVSQNPLNYDSWFDYLRLEDSPDRIREIYERAIASVPRGDEKRYWQRYIYLWINYALYEETEAGDVERTRHVYRECLKLIPHAKFSFAKIWLLAAQFEIRQLNLTAARNILGNAIGNAPRDKIFKNYIEMELQLGNIDRCRKLYERYLEWSPENCYAWGKYAELESSLAETQRARAIFELATSQPALDMPELLWKAYIDFEISQGELERTRALYERLLSRTKHYKVWVSFAKFEASSAAHHHQDCIGRARAIFERANEYYKHSAPELREERATLLLEDWLNMEKSFGDVTLVHSKLPKRLKKRKALTREDGATEYAEYVDYLFPEESQTTNLKILEAALKWKKQKVAACS